MSTQQTDLGFADRAPVLELCDPLAEFLGVLRPGRAFRYTFEDAVKLSGHSCPTVASAFLMTVAALRALYPDSVPVRGRIEVTVGGAPADGSAGPIAQVIALLTGAAPETGFGGLMGKWGRRNLLRFDGALPNGSTRFRRTDTGAAVEVVFDGSGVPPSPDLPRLMTAAMTGRASVEERRRFAELWQKRVEEMLTGSLDRVVRVRRIAG